MAGWFPLGTNGATTWGQVKIGAGGQLTGIDAMSDGTMVIRTDTYGAYLYNRAAANPGNAGGTGAWQQLVTNSSMPTGEGAFVTCPITWNSTGPGVFEIRIAPSNTSRLYMIFNDCVYRSDNKGAPWTRTAFTQVSLCDANHSPTKFFGPFIAIDPQNADVVFVGTTNNGLFKSTDAGATWSAVSGVASSSGTVIVCFDPSSSVVSGKKQGLFASSYGTGVYHSTDGGANWTLLNTTGMPTTHRHMVCDGAGKLWFTDNTQTTRSAWSWVPSAWTNLTPVANLGANYWATVAIDSATSGSSLRVLLVSDGGQYSVTVNNGGSWTGTIPSAGVTPVATDIPWLAVTHFASPNKLGTSEAIFDPFGSNSLYIAGGTAIWNMAPLNADGSMNATSVSAGIEQLVARSCISPASGKPVCGFEDKPVFYVNDPTIYPSSHGVNYAETLMTCYGLDWCSSSPSTVVAFVQSSLNQDTTAGISTNGGQTDVGSTNWTTFVAMPAEISSKAKLGGCIAASTPTNLVIQVAQCGSIYNTKDGGATWNQITIGGATDDCGWFGNQGFHRQNICADRVDANTFYAFNDGTGAGGAGLLGIWKSTNSGDTWSRVNSGPFDGSNDQISAKLRSVPGQSGHLFFSAGEQSPGPWPHTIPFYRSTNHGTTWTAVTNIKEVWGFGFGAIKPGQSYPSVFIWGWVTTIDAVNPGFYRSDDNCSTWVSIGGAFPSGSVDQINWVEGDANTYGTVYACLQGSGVIYGKMQ